MIQYSYIFPTPFYHGVIADKLNSIIEEFSEEDLTFNGENFSSYDSNENNNKSFSNTLLTQITPLLLEFGNYCSKSFKGNITNHWIQDYQLNSYHSSHIHPNSVVSCIYYLRAKNPANISFINPNVIQTMYNSDLEKLTITPTAGSFIMFPSWIYHSVEQVTDKYSERTVVAFNVE